MGLIGRGETRRGRDFPVDEAARLLALGVHLPDYPTELIAEAWHRNYQGAVAALLELERHLDGSGDLLYGTRRTLHGMARGALDRLGGQ